MRKEKKIKKLILLIDESILYLERERDKQKRREKYYSSICFQCFMFTKWKVGKLFPPEVELHAKKALYKKERIVYQAFNRASSSTLLQLTLYI